MSYSSRFCRPQWTRFFLMPPTPHACYQYSTQVSGHEFSPAADAEMRRIQIRYKCQGMSSLMPLSRSKSIPCCRRPRGPLRAPLLRMQGWRPPTTIELHLLAGIHRSQVAYRSMAIARQYAPRDWDRKTIWSKNPSRSPPTRWGKRARSGCLKEILFPELLFLRLRSTLSFCRS
jgi:hypothetical protein